MTNSIHSTATRKEHWIRVVVKDMATDEVIHDRIIDHNFRNDRIWLGKTSTWALHNGLSILSEPVIED